LKHTEEGGEVSFSLPPVSWLQTQLVKIAGGIPVWEDLEASGGWTIVNIEQIAVWDPDQIFIINYDGTASEVAADLKDSDFWSDLKAVQDGQLFAFPFDFYSWDQPDTRWILGLQWLATKIQPELMTNLDILDEVNSFYSQLYGLDQDVINAEVMPEITGDIP
jgi:iron complex transport system substrate-binding protein